MALPLSSIDKLIQKMDLETVCKYSNELGEAKEEHQAEIMEAYDKVSMLTAQQYYNETYNTK